MRNLFFVFAFILFFPLLSFASNGVERGSVRDAIQSSDEGMEDDLLDFISDAVAAKCSLENAKILSVVIQKTDKEVDQGIVDSFYKIQISLSVDGKMDAESINLEVAKYYISNPAAPNKEILSITSAVCK